MSYRLHPTKNKNLKLGEQKWYQIEIGYGDNRETKVLQFPSERSAQLYDNDMKRMHRPSVATLIAPSFEQMLPEFLEWYGLHRQPRALQAWLQSWNNLSPHFGKLKPNHLTPALIDQYKSHRLAQKAGVRSNLICKRTVQKEINCLSGIIRFATERSFCEPIPFKISTFPKSQTAPRKKIIPTPDQVEAMLAQTRSDLRPLYQLLYYTGMRSEEARTITAGNVNIESGVILVSGKGNKQRIIPIIPQLKPVLEELKKGKKPEEILLISKRSGKAYKPNIGRVGASAQKVGITAHMSAHMFRHCFATHCIYWGLDTRTVQMLLGHSAITTTQMYTELAASFLTQQMSRFGQPPTKTEVKPKQKQLVKSKGKKL